MPLISVRTFGPIELRVDGGEAPPGLRWRKHAALLIYLLLSPRRTRTRSHLLGLLWGEKSESAARHSLNEALRMLRKAAGDDGIRVEGEAVTLDDANVECDALAFDAAFAEARWKDAAQLVGGDFLEGFDLPDAPAFEDWVAAERERRRSRGIEALAAACGEALREGMAPAALRLAERASALDALSERAACALMRARWPAIRAPRSRRSPGWSGASQRRSGRPRGPRPVPSLPGSSESPWARWPRSRSPTRAGRRS